MESCARSDLVLVRVNSSSPFLIILCLLCVFSLSLPQLKKSSLGRDLSPPVGLCYEATLRTPLFCLSDFHRPEPERDPPRSAFFLLPPNIARENIVFLPPNGYKPPLVIPFFGDVVVELWTKPVSAGSQRASRPPNVRPLFLFTTSRQILAWSEDCALVRRPLDLADPPLSLSVPAAWRRR